MRRKDDGRDCSVRGLPVSSRAVLLEVRAPGDAAVLGAGCWVLAGRWNCRGGEQARFVRGEPQAVPCEGEQEVQDILVGSES
jgi:hypothetical protein